VHVQDPARPSKTQDGGAAQEKVPYRASMPWW